MKRSRSVGGRRRFLGTLGGVAAIVAASAAPESVIAELPRARKGAPGDWDMSWVERVQQGQYTAVFDSTTLSDGAAPALASDILGGFKDAYGTIDNCRMVIVMRQAGQKMGFNDYLWDRYEIGEQEKINDPVTNQPTKRNPFASAGPGEEPWDRDSKLDALHKNGAVFLVCNRASMNWATGTAERMKLDVEQVKADVRKNLVPGAYLMPTGVFGLVRAQNAGCAYMRGS